MVLVGLFFCVEKLRESMGDMELWGKSNRVWQYKLWNMENVFIMGNFPLRESSIEVS